MINSRTKGRAGEQEIARMLRQIPGLPEISRNLEQTARGGADILSVPGVAIEVKRCETLCLPRWWRQAVNQAQREHAIPVLVWRRNREAWTVRTIVRREIRDMTWEAFTVLLQILSRGRAADPATTLRSR
jgi:hypothetical protein